MLRYLIRIAFKALIFMYVLPLIPGIDFHGNFKAAFGLAIIFSLILWAVEAVSVALAALWTVSTLGLALLIIIPLWILGFWILPALALLLVSDTMPTTLTITGWLPAILGGLVMLIVGILTGTITRVRDAARH
jgi:uncharacterized membrane protein YvlD (DUF360 family)